jgi:predicted permease
VTACVLAIACANLAGLLLARGESRRAEIALRLSLGASRGRIVRQLLTETVLLSVSGGVLGLGLAIYGCRLVERFFGYHLPDMRLSLDWPVAGASMVLSVVTGVAFGLAPAMRATRLGLAAGMRERQIAGSFPVAAQIALSVVLLVCAGLLLQTTRALFVRPGVDPERIAHFRLRPSRLGYSLERARTYQREILRRLQAVPGVESAVLARVPPDRGWCCPIEVARPGERPFEVEQNEVIPGFLSAMGIGVLQGRDFLDGDRDVAVVNQALAARLWPGQSAVGQEIRVGGLPHVVIGVAAASHPQRPGESPHPYLYLPMWSRDAKDPRLFVRVNGQAAPMLEALRREVVAVDSEVHVGQDSTLAGRTALSHQRERLMAATLEFAGGSALVLSAIGLYGLMAYQVSRRTREIGIRMAVGARAGQVALWTMRWALTVTGAGLAAGLLAAWQATRLLEGFLFGVAPRDPTTFAAASLVLAVVSVTASVLPAWRAARLEPAVALRHE